MKAKYLALSVLLVLYAHDLGGQQPEPEINDATATVNAALMELRVGIYSSIAAKRLARLGDEAAEAVIDTHSLREMSVRPMSIAIAQVISESFSGPCMIVRESDKTPKRSILLLTYLRYSVKTPEEIRAVDLADEVVNRQVQAQATQDK